MASEAHVILIKIIVTFNIARREIIHKVSSKHIVLCNAFEKFSIGSQYDLVIHT